MSALMLDKLKYLRDDEKKALMIFEDRVRKALSSNLLAIELFGSKVRGDFNWESDIDIFILVGEFTSSVVDDVAAISSDISVKYGILISPVVFSRDEYDKNNRSNTLFFQELNSCGVLLYGKV